MCIKLDLYILCSSQVDFTENACVICSRQEVEFDSQLQEMEASSGKLQNLRNRRHFTCKCATMREMMTEDFLKAFS